MKAVVFDAGPLINLSMNGLLYILPGLKKASGAKFIVPREIKREIYDKPVGIKKFELGAMRLNELIEKKILEFPDVLGIDKGTIELETQRLLEIANHTLRVKKHWITLVSKGEMASFAVSALAEQKNIESVVAIDERTARMLVEGPENLKELMSKKLHKRLLLAKDAATSMPKINCIRSSELVFVAHKLGLSKLKDPRALEAMLYATKFKGTAISIEELEVLKNL